jgi:hypothetical protein
MKIEDPLAFARHGGYDIEIHGLKYNQAGAKEMIRLGVQRMSMVAYGKHIGDVVEDGGSWSYVKRMAFEEAKHKRGGDQKNKGRFSKQHGSGGKEADQRSNERSERNKARKGSQPSEGSGKSSNISQEPTQPPKVKPYIVDPNKSSRKSGVTDAARVGVPADAVPPPPKMLPRLPNLTPDERAVETAFAKAFEASPQRMVKSYLSAVQAKSKRKGSPPTFETDEVKSLSGDWNDDDDDRRLEKRARYNTALHQTANAVAKKAFRTHLDTMKKGQTILVTCGGCGAGKGYALTEGSKAHPETLGKIAAGADAVWDSAGDQNGTESPWVLNEAAKRGLKVHFLYVHADPKNSWAGKFGVVSRARSNGRMVDAKVFADSYAIGAKNHHRLHQTHKDNPNVDFTFLHNSGPVPQVLPAVPEDSLEWDSKQISDFAVNQITERHESGELKAPHVYRAARAGADRIWR